MNTSKAPPVTYAKVRNLLDWYFDQEADPTIRALLPKLEADACIYCEAKVGQLHRVGCPKVGELHRGYRASSSGGLESPEMRAMVRQAAIGWALESLDQAQRHAVVTAWVFRRQYQWWSAHVGNDERSTPSRALPQHAAAYCGRGEANKLKAHYRQEWRRLEKRGTFKTALAVLEKLRREGALW